MNCQEAQKLVHAYVDGELDLMKNLEIEQHLQECAGCAQAYADLQAVRAAVKGSSLYFDAPPDLHKRIQFTLRGARKSGSAPRPLPRLWLAVAASLAFVAIAGWGGLVSVLRSRSADTSLAQALVISHIRSQQLPDRRIDVESSNQHVIKPWFQGKVDFALPSVKDLGNQGFPLLGGRLDYLDNRRVAALVYRRNKHYIDLFIWPSTPGSEAVPEALTREGYHMRHWTQSGMTYWAVSDLNESELEGFVRLIQNGR